VRIGYFLSSEEHSPNELLAIASAVHEAGFRDFWISDHYHPWIDHQGHSPFVWSVIGALAGRFGGNGGIRVTTAVTCPTFRTHPAVIAQAAATSACLLEGRFILGVGTGEALNEHILGQHWPPAHVRLEMLDEAVSVIRQLWTGEEVNWRGAYYTVENARIYSRPHEPPPVFMSAFGPKATDLAARIADGFISTQPDAENLRRYRDANGAGPAQGGLKVCWATDEQQAAKTLHELWPTSGVPGQLSQDLPTPAHFEQASKNVTPEQLVETTPCGPDPERYVKALQEYEQAGFDEVYVMQVGPDIDGFLGFWKREVEPRL
jgi:G6PDH family F420-dependent oxidoreductase